MILDARLVELKKKEAREEKQYEFEMEKAKAAQKSAPNSNKFGDVRKCPTCLLYTSYTKAANQAYARAQYNLALSYDKGEGVRCV